MKKPAGYSLLGIREIFANRNIVAMTISLTMFHFSINLVLPWWPLYLKELGSSIEIIGALSTVQGILAFAAVLPGGALADRYGRRTTILVGQVFRLMAPLLYLLAHRWEELIPGLIAQSLGMVNQPAVYSITLESLPETRRTTGFSLIQTILVAVSSSTMLIGGFLMDTLGVVDGMRTILIIWLIFEIARFLIRLLFLSETLPRKKHHGYGLKESFDPSVLKLGRSFWAMLATRCLFQMGYSMSNPFIVLYVVEDIGLTKIEWGFIQMSFQAFYAVFSLPGAMFAQKFGNRTAVILSGIIAPLPLFSYVFLRDLGSLLVTNIISGIGMALGGAADGGGPAWQSMLADLVSPEKRGRAMGLMGLAAGVTGSVAPIMGALTWVALTPTSTLLCSGMMETSSSIVLHVFNEEPHNKTPSRTGTK